jgi:L-amino acid N-acyltransferase YncA
MPWLPELHSEAETIAWIEHVVLPHQDVWVVEVDDRVVGVAALDGKVLEQLYVLPSHQGQGVGSDLLQVAMGAAGDTLKLWTFQRNTTARAFYERHGFSAVRFTNGADNEELEPDVLYYRTTSKPILFVDIDGVLNPFGGDCPAGYVDHDLFPQDDLPIRICQDHSDWLTELSSHFDLVWATGWNASDRKVLGSVLALPTFHGAAEMPPVPFVPSDKVPGVAAIAGERACVWIDDLVTPEAKSWARERDAPTLLIETQSHLGMTSEHVDELIAWRQQLKGTMKLKLVEKQPMIDNVWVFVFEPEEP